MQTGTILNEGQEPVRCATGHSIATRHLARDRRVDLLRQSAAARTLGSPFVAEVLAAAFRQLSLAPRLEALIASWPLDPASSAMALRLNAGFHAVARRRVLPALTTLYEEGHGRFDRAIGEALALEEDTLLAWMAHPTQTNEVRRSSAYMAALMVLARKHGHAFELLEIGASAGLNLLLDRYAHDLGGVAAGDPDSSLRLAPAWQGPPPPQATVSLASARGVDLRPLRLDDPLTRERLESYVWPGDEARASALRSAIGIARAAMPAVDEASAAPWLAHKLRAPQATGTTRVVLHSMVRQYLPDDERAAVDAAIAQAGREATPNRVLARIGFEWCPARTRVELTLSTWDGLGESGRPCVLATCHPYGAAITLHG